jgi:hypothetical protein
MAELTLNPHTELVLISREGDLVEITASAPIRGRALAITTFSKAKHPGEFDLLRRLAEKSGAVSVELKRVERDRLKAAGLLVPKDEIPRPVRLRSPLADPPRELLPQSAKRSRKATSAELCVNPTLQFQDDLRPPDETWLPKTSAVLAPANGRHNPLASDCAWAFVEHPDAAVKSAISLNEAERAVFRRLAPGAPPPGDLGKTLIARLKAADVLLDPEDAERRRFAQRQALKEAADRLRRERYAVVQGLIAPRMIAGLRRYFRDLIAEGHVSFGDPQVRRRFRAHNEPMARVLHKALAPLVTELAGEPMLPSYVYLGSYRAPSVLKPHVDRPQCALSISLLIDYVPEPDGPSPWPLYLKDTARSGPPFAARLHLGDGLFYRGTELTHWRDALPRGHTSTSLFFHFVPADFKGRLD